MFELGLIAALFFILIAVIASYLLKAAINKSGIAEATMEKTALIGIGLPPILSAKAKFILPGSVLPGIKKLGASGKVYLMVARATFFLGVLSIVVGAAWSICITNACTRTRPRR